MSRVTFDESLVEQLEALYRTGDILRRRALVYEALGAQPGESILDAGCGPGFYVAELSAQVGEGGSVTGVDTSPQMLAVARKRCDALPNVDFREGAVTALPLADESFHRALSVQVLEYVEDASAAFGELHRALRPGGRVVVWDVDWSTVSWHSADEIRMKRVLEAWDDHLAHPALPRLLGARMREAGFTGVEVRGHAFVADTYSPDAYGVAAIPVIERYVAGHDDVGPELAAAWAEEQRTLGERGEFFFSCVQVGVAATRPSP